jgi:hypothetical protein
MGEQFILVCDVCGKPAAETATIKVGNRSFVKDYCSTHLSELTAGARAPRRGRRRALVASAAATAPKRRGRPKGSTTKKSTAKRSTAKRRGRPKKSTAKRRGRPRKTAARRGRPPKSAAQSSS